MTQTNTHDFTKKYLEEIAKDIDDHCNRSLFAGWVFEEAARKWQRALEAWAEKAQNAATPPQPKPVVWTISKGPYYRCEDAETKKHLFDIGRDLQSLGWNLFLPERTVPFTTIIGAKQAAQTYLKSRGYQDSVERVIP